MIRYLADENLNRNIVRGLLSRSPNARVILAQDAGLGGMPDPAVLCWAAANSFVLLTHDRNTMAGYANARIRRGERCAGVFVIHHRAPAARVIEELLMIMECTAPCEWENRVV